MRYSLVALRRLAEAEQFLSNLARMQYCVYVIYNRDHSKTYIGETNDLAERLKAHNEHRFTTSYTTRFSGLWELIYTEECNNRIQARKREKQLKSYQGRQFIKTTIPW